MLSRCMSVLRISLQSFCGAVDGLARYALVLKMCIAIREASSLSFLLRRAVLARPRLQQQSLQFISHALIIYQIKGPQRLHRQSLGLDSGPPVPGRAWDPRSPNWLKLAESFPRSLRNLLIKHYPCSQTAPPSRAVASAPQIAPGDHGHPWTAGVRAGPPGRRCPLSASHNRRLCSLDWEVANPPFFLS